MSNDSLPISPLAVPFPRIEPVRGVEMSTGRAGYYKHERKDVLLMRFAAGTTCAGVFTRHGVGSAPVDWCKQALAASGGVARGLVVNAGCANAFTGEPGAAAVSRLTAAVSESLGCRPEEVMNASTGVIGVLLDETRIVDRLADLTDRLTPDGWADAGAAIMTTDTFAKGATASVDLGGTTARIAGIAKGSGMIAPNMATMLAFVATDAAVTAPVLQALIGELTVVTFNAVTVDGDRSTNDTLLVFATGACGAAAMTSAEDPRLPAFRAALQEVLLNLAMQLVRDGEGASKFVKITVEGAESDGSARRIARTIAESPLVKTAFAGEDANWGRIVMAVGRADEPIRREKLSVWFGPLAAAKDGKIAADYSEEAMSAYMKNAELEVGVDVGVGQGRAVMWTCDLTKQYVAINGDYRS